ncbi:MAG: YegS/Rv2252/BmrU family lipid kinase [Lachnospiraceae bacterium]|nr:YegS/Rv2252/BmrU family lipid kinase [Lachnospiraceae bacterium]
MYHFILNPTAASGGGRKVWRKVKALLREYDIDYKLHIFDDKKALTECVKELSNGQNGICNHIVVMGGDGTLNMVVNAIDNFNAVKLSCLKVGSGNDFARNVGVRKKAIRELVHLIKKPEEILLDVGEAVYLDEDDVRHVRRYLISSGIGYDADICEEAERSRLKKVLNKIKLGKLVYLFVGLKQVMTKKGSMALIYLDNKRIGIREMFFAVSMIHPMEGGGVPFCPYADPGDGKLDVCVVKIAKKPKLYLEVALVYLKKHLLFSNVKNYRVNNIRIVLAKPEWVHFDGETPSKVREIEHRCMKDSRLTFVK